MIAVDAEVTASAVAVKGAVVAPAETVTLAGTVATAVFELERVTTAPPVGAGPLRVMVPAEVVLPGTTVGLTAIALRPGLTARVAVFVAL
jgi:hypothetical protein